MILVFDMDTIKKPTLKEFNKINDFADSCIELQKTLSHLNNFVEVVKRTGDVDTLRRLDNELRTFLTDFVDNYKYSLSDDED